MPTSGPAYIDVFRFIRVMPDDVTIAADAVNDTLTIVAGAGISLVTNAETDQLTIVNTSAIETQTLDAVVSLGNTTSKSIVVSGIKVGTTRIETIESNADLELDASGTGQVSVIGSLKVNGTSFTNSDIDNWNTAFNLSNQAIQAGAIVPWIIPEGQTVVVTENRQGCFVLPIEINGVLEVNGILIEV
jgi:hypothetical protein